MKRRHILLISSTLILIPSLNSFAEIYKWTDENGNTVFSERKPASSQNDVETVSPKVSGGRRAVEAEDFVDDESGDNDASDEEAPKDSEAEVAEKNRLVEEKNCKTSQQRFITLQRPRVNDVAQDGTRRVMGEDERQAELAKAEAAIKEWCK